MSHLRYLRCLGNYQLMTVHRIRACKANTVPVACCACGVRTCSSKATGQRFNAKTSLSDGPGLKDFILGANSVPTQESITEEAIPYLNRDEIALGKNRKVYFDVYGCQMNVNDTEVVWAVLKKAGFSKTEHVESADVVLVVTCAIREGAETKIWNRLEYLKGLKKARSKKKKLPPMKIGILGCMAERLKERLLERERAVDMVAGPDAYKDLPRLLALTENNQTAVNVLLSLDETYADVMPVRLNQDSVTAYISITRGCDNMCTFCIVPFTRGRERSRPISSILDEVRHLSDEGVKELTLLGQNVNSYRDLSQEQYYRELSKAPETHMSRGFKTVYKPKQGGLRFAHLLDQVSSVDPEMRIRFTSPHPKDFPDEVLHLIRERHNICKTLHLPAQSGNDRVLERMRRGYTREAYLELVALVRELVPDITLSSDFICGFCGETDEEFKDTLSLIERVKYHTAYLFPYSLREKTVAHRKLQDDVPPEVKNRRLVAMVNIFRKGALMLNEQQIGLIQLVLVEGFSKRSNEFFAGRNDGNTKVIIPAMDIPEDARSSHRRPIVPGDYVVVQINAASSQVLKGIPLYHSTLQEFHQMCSKKKRSVFETFTINI